MGFKGKNYTTLASWYGPGFDGKITASGEIFEQDSLVAASPYLPFNTLVKITNVANNKSVLVRITDRGPFNTVKGTTTPIYPLEPHSTRGFDLSKGAFEQIADLETGVIKVTYEIYK